jgi:hypothetical protein
LAEQSPLEQVQLYHVIEKDLDKRLKSPVLRIGMLALLVGITAASVPVSVASAGSSESREAPTIEIEVGDIRIRVTGRVDRSLLRDVLSAARVVSR